MSTRFSRLADQLRGYHHLHGQDALHQIRVEIKKLKTIINLLHFSYPGFKRHSNFVPLRVIFRRAGEIREPEVLYRLLLTYEIDGVANKYIPHSTEVDQLSLTFQKDVPRFLQIVKLQKKKLKDNCKSVSKDSYKAYKKKLKEELKPLLFPRLRKKMLHKARKLVKEILYLNELYDKTKKQQFFQQVERIIGRWHDQQVLLLLLKKIKSSEKIDQLKINSREEEFELEKLTSDYYEVHKK